MSIILSGVTYTPPQGSRLLDGVSFTVPVGGKMSLTGDNGSGKSTLLQIVAGLVEPSGGTVSTKGTLYYIPQQPPICGRVTDALGCGPKTDALDDILGGSTDESNYTTLDDDWDITDRIGAALEAWGLGHLSPDTAIARLSGGEATRVLLAGVTLHRPDVILMDEPTNHLDRAGRGRLYRFVSQSPATILTVSHDRELLELCDTTLALSRGRVTRYGGPYSFYIKERDRQEGALVNQLTESEKALRAARRKAAETLERKNKEDSRGRGKLRGEGIPRIMADTIRDGAERSGAAIAARHEARIASADRRRQELKARLVPTGVIKVKMETTPVPGARVLYMAEGINFGYGPEQLWPAPVDVTVRADSRFHIRGCNGSGKTTLLRLITGGLEPTCGRYRRNDFSHVYLDQRYSVIDDSLSVCAQMEKFNIRALPGSLLRTELDRYLFPSDAWDKPCAVLSGGERMRLALCCVLTADNAPDMLVLDEPTNNLDLRNMRILSSVLQDFKGALVLVCHDEHFAREAGIGETIEL